MSGQIREVSVSMRPATWDGFGFELKMIVAVGDKVFHRTNRISPEMLLASGAIDHVMRDFGIGMREAIQKAETPEDVELRREIASTLHEGQKRSEP